MLWHALPQPQQHTLRGETCAPTTGGHAFYASVNGSIMRARRRT